MVILVGSYPGDLVNKHVVWVLGYTSVITELCVCVVNSMCNC